MQRKIYCPKKNKKKLHKKSYLLNHYTFNVLKTFYQSKLHILEIFDIEQISYHWENGPLLPGQGHL